MAQGNGNYHIYIHQTKEVVHKHVTTQKISLGGGGKGTRSSGFGSSSKNKKIPSQVPGASIGNTIMSVAKNGWSAAGVIGIAVAVVKATEQAQKCVGKLAEQTASYTGDYTWTTWWNNMAQTQHNILHPISSYIKAQTTEASWAKASKKTDEQRTLLGDTAINTLTKGV